ncbi:MAG: ABC transporter ATP-binding protein [Phycisphaerales bacterium]|nr:MAG: ABC transporter ATP-binding protein [Phycisphaerales bacterium]
MSDAPTVHTRGISACGLVKHYEGGRVRAVDGLDLTIDAGEFVAICGPSGCGKTTLLNLLAAVDRPDSGSLSVDGQVLTEMSETGIDTFRRVTVGLVFQLHNLLPDLSALENVQVPLLGAGVSRNERLKRASALLERVDLLDRKDALPAALSGGERQRVAIARALANRPSILLADEPTGALDSRNGQRLLDLLDDLQRENGTTLVVVTHEQSVASRAGRILNMLDGRMTDGAA